MLEFAQTALVTVISFLFVLTFVVTVHELGHFLAAKSFGVAIDRFSIGFGRALFTWRDKAGVEWRIGMWPLGGYVRFSGDVNDASVPDQDDLEAMREWIEYEEGKEGLKRYFHFKPLWQRAVVVAAGPIANFLLAIVLFALLLMTVGDVTSAARVHAISAGSPAERAGFKIGDLVEKADGRKIASNEDLSRYVMLRGHVPMKIEVLRGEERRTLSVTPVIRKVDDPISGPQDVGVLGIESPPALVAQVSAGSPAATAGFAPNDLIVAADSRRIGSFDDLFDYVAARPNTSVRFTVQREGQPVELTVLTGTRQIKASNGEVSTIGLLGVVRPRVESDVRRIRYSPLAALPAGAARTWDVLDTTVYYLGRLIRGEVWLDQLGGPIRIAQASGAVAKVASEGAPNLPTMVLAAFVGLLGLAAILSVSIGFMNLLPVPVLDGGHLLFYAYEAVARRPLAAKVQAAGYRVGLALLLGFMLFATWNDIQRLSVFNFLGGLFS